MDEEARRAAAVEAQADPMYVRAISLAVIVEKEQFWPDEEVNNAKRHLQRGFGHVPSLHELAGMCGPELVEVVASRVFSQRVGELRQRMEQAGIGSPCHLCDGPREEHDPAYVFGLANILSDERQWGGAVATLALNVFTLPFGVAVGATPGRSVSAKIARCNLVLCGSCGQKQRGFFGGWKIGQHHCERHPSWRRLMAAGYTKFLDETELAKFQ